MIDIDEARRRADEALRSLQEDSGASLRWFDGVMGVETLRETKDAWLFYFNSDEYLRTEDVFRQFLSGPIVVPKNGDEAWVMGTALPEGEQLRQRGLS